MSRMPPFRAAYTWTALHLGAMLVALALAVTTFAALQPDPEPRRVPFTYVPGNTLEVGP